ncbi:sigma-70 family RNA polymerase sigma factor [Polyangium jinanense]|uniref:Sigma-70 family RNA polymerase sigma factor n=1 Tax=Polyangium jinanense TaxID=2829994 RepID=A0A9X3XDZ8_9BACT|nr:sigma-70 family RNA polymerase sigma factor [Polyangium jinanense]MDC3959223.1 sigma-70 family RNA polymerase sigma factor [Polyangium jinanense]MDC3987685.1 sigma-70 family RNA polymerase sigma factor [Polyangium jinanense]
MTNEKNLIGLFEESRSHLRAVAYRMLGSRSEADDAVQETWLRLSRAETSEVENLRGWLTTVVARVCLDMLRSRKARAEDGDVVPEEATSNAEDEAVLADSVSIALLVVLETLEPVERLAFVLHDLFGVSFEQIAPIVGRSEVAARQLASRARRRVRGAPERDEAELARQHDIVKALLGALRAGDVEAVVAVLDPNVVVHGGGAGGRAREIRSVRNLARSAIGFARTAHAFDTAEPALVDGTVGAIYAPGGRLSRALRLTFGEGVITRIDVIDDEDGLKTLEITTLG